VIPPILLVTAGGPRRRSAAATASNAIHPPGVALCPGNQRRPQIVCPLPRPSDDATASGPRPRSAVVGPGPMSRRERHRVLNQWSDTDFRTGEKPCWALIDRVFPLPPACSIPPHCAPLSASSSRLSSTGPVLPLLLAPTPADLPVALPRPVGLPLLAQPELRQPP